MELERAPSGHFAELYPRESVLDIAHHQTNQPFVTSRMVADELGCSLERARQHLNALASDDKLVKQRVGRGAVVYYPPEWAPGHEDESIAFFPDRRELMLDDPSEHTRERVSRFAHLVDGSGDDFLYKIDERDVWQSPYESAGDLIRELRDVTPERSPRLEEQIRRDWERAHTFRLETREDGETVLRYPDADAAAVLEDVRWGDPTFKKHGDRESVLRPGRATRVKRTLYEHGYPVEDYRDLDPGAHLAVDLAEDISLRDYQAQWVANFQERLNGVFAAASGTGKTVAAIGAMCELGSETLIIVPGREVASQWERELLAKTTLSEWQVGQYHGGEKDVSPVTIATYTIVSMERHFDLFNDREWGLIIYDECHHIAAEEWSTSADVQGRARLGLSATPVREAENSDEIYTLIGPPIGTDWEALFREGWVVKPDVEIQYLPWASDLERARYEEADGHEQRQAAAANPAKLAAIEDLLAEHAGEKILIFVEWIDQGNEYADALDIPFIYGETPHSEREELLAAYRAGELDRLVMSRVGDEGIDLPNAEVVIIASSLGSSRAQHAQRVGRAMRPVGDATAYVLATATTEEMDFARHGMQYLEGKGVSVTETELAKASA